MKVVSTDSFDGPEQALTAELIRDIRGEIEKADTPVTLFERLTGGIAYGATSVWDDVGGLEADVLVDLLWVSARWSEQTAPGIDHTLH